MPILSMFSLLALVVGAPTPRYELVFSPSTPRRVEVRAEFVLTDSLLRMVPYGAEHLPDGWRTFVRDEALVSATGAPVSLTRIDERRWRVGAPIGTTVRLSYGVVIEHDLQRWTPDAREAAYSRDWGTFAVGRALFIFNSASDSGITISIRSPDGWPVSTAWQPVGAAGANAYRVASWGEAVNSVVFAGRAQRFEVQEGPVHVAFVLGGPGFDQSAPLLRDATKQILRSYLDLFGGAPPAARLLVVINPDTSLNGGGGGGVFRQSISMTFDRPPTTSDIMGWGHTLSHELFHIWNASAMVRAGQEEEWMVEGIADYYSVLTMTRLGYFPVSGWGFKAGQWIRQYQSVAGKISLKQAGLQEWEAPGPTMLYMGGASAALSLDLAIRGAQPTGDGLDGAMRSLYQRRANNGSRFTIADLQEEAVRAGFPEAPAFFTRYVMGTDSIPVQHVFDALGVSLESGTLKLAAPTVAQTAARLRYFGGRADLAASVTDTSLPVARVEYVFTGTLTGEPVQFTITTRSNGTVHSATLHSVNGTAETRTVRIDGATTTIEFDIHGMVLKVELKAGADGRFTGTWQGPERSESIAGRRRMLHN